MDMVSQTAQDFRVRLNLGIHAQVRLLHHIHSDVQKLYQDRISALQQHDSPCISEFRPPDLRQQP